MICKINNTKLPKKDEDLEILSDKDLQVFSDDRITNIAVFGLDNDEGTGISRLDSIMIASVDKRHICRY